ncbi:hypothetical protein KAU11_10700, partial [Candidatus Babeliales bacterium]|nr:hypothetical protein [Candidatus Babeliales bacterium]
MEQVNLFTNGMDLDTSPELMGQGSYRYMLNGDIVKNNRGAKGVAVNEDGNLEISIIWPADNVEGASPLTPYSSNWIISKGIHDRDDLVLIYKDTAGSGQVKIDLLKFNADNSFTRIHLVDGADVGIGADNKVDAFISHETPELIRLYFYSKSSTGNTKLKHLNISPDLVGGVLQDSKLQVSYTRVNALTSVNLEIMPYVDKLLFEWYYDWNYYFTYVKGNLRVGKYVYYWRALNNGVYSEWVQITQAIPVSSTVDKPNIDQQKGEYTTNDTGNINSTIGIKLTGLGSISAEMEVARAWYSEFKGIPEVAVIYRGGGGGVSDTSYDNIIGIIDPIEFNILKPFISPKTHSVKDNTLFLGNIEEDYFDVEYDARAYRFNNLGIAEVENRRISPGVFIDSAGAWEAQVAAFDLEDDLVNPFNQDYSKGLKYKTDGTTIGGEGINVSYTITVVERKVSTEDESTNSLAVAYTENLVLQLDEIYRFGVVFYDGYMRRSPVKWIGDIRMPKHHEIIGQIGNDGFVRAMGAKVLFNIDVFNHPELQNKSFRIVSAKREGTDRTVLYEGIGTPAYRPLGLYTLPSMVANNPDYTTAFTVSGALDSFGNTYLDEVILFNSPEISFFKNAK